MSEQVDPRTVQLVLSAVLREMRTRKFGPMSLVRIAREFGTEWKP